MARTRTIDIDSYDAAQVNAALDLIIQLTGDIAPVMSRMTSDQRRLVWRQNTKSRTLGRKLREIVTNTEGMDPRAS